MQKYLWLVACLSISCPAFAQTVEQDGPLDKYSTATERAQGTFLAYHEAMRAEESCRQHSFSPGDRTALEKATADQMFADSPQIAIGAARLLTLVRKADDDMDALVAREGCNGQKVKKSLALYEDKLAAVHGQEDAPPPGVGDTAASAPGPQAASQAAAAPQAPVEVVPEPLTPPSGAPAPQPVTAPAAP